MTRRLSSALLLGAALLASHCGSVLAPTGTLAAFSSKIVSPSNPAVAVSAAASSKTIQVVGTISAPDSCYQLSGAVTNTDEITLRVSASANPAAICLAVVSQFTYSASITGLAAGSYRLKVIHNDKLGAEVVVLSQIIAVP